METMGLLVRPLHEFSIDGEYCSGDDLRILPLKPTRRRLLLEVAKANDCWNDVLTAANEAKSLIVIPLPAPWVAPNSLILSAAVFRPVGDRLLARVVDCLRIFSDAPDCGPHGCTSF